MSQEPSISVILPVKNGGASIVEALKCLAFQTRRPDQVVVVDDGSTDNTAHLVLNLPAECPVTLVSMRGNMGVPLAFKEGYREAWGDWICGMSHDDSFRNDYFERMLGAVKRYPGAKVVSCVGDWHHAQTGLRWKMGADISSCERFFTPEQLVDACRAGHYNIPSHGTMVKAEAIKEFGLQEFACFDFWLMWAPMMRYGLAFVPEPMASYQVSEDGWYKTIRRDQERFQGGVADILDLLNKYPDIKDRIDRAGAMRIFGRAYTDELKRRGQLTSAVWLQTMAHAAKSALKDRFPRLAQAYVNVTQ